MSLKSRRDTGQGHYHPVIACDAGYTYGLMMEAWAISLTVLQGNCTVEICKEYAFWLLLQRLWVRHYSFDGRLRSHSLCPKKKSYARSILLTAAQKDLFFGGGGALRRPKIWLRMFFNPTYELIEVNLPLPTISMSSLAFNISYTERCWTRAHNGDPCYLTSS